MAALRSMRSRLEKLAQHEIARLVSGAAFVFSSRVTGAVTVFVTQILLVRWMGAEELGIYVYVFAWCILISVVSGLGFSSVAFRFIAKGLAEDRLDYVSGFIRGGTRTVFSASVLFVAIGLGLVVFKPGLVADDKLSAMVLALLSVPLYAMLTWFSGVAHGFSWFRAAFLPGVVIRPLVLLVAICSVWYLTHALSAASVMLMHMVIMLLVLVGLSFAVLRGFRQKSPSVKPAYRMGEWARAAAPLLIVSLFTSYFLELNIIIAGMYLDSSQLAVYNISFRIALFIAFGIHAVDAITMPRAARLYAQNDTAALQTVITRSTKLKFWGALSAVIAVAVAGKYILAFFGDEFVAGYQTLMVLALTQLVAAALGPLTHLLNIAGHQNHCLYVFLFSLLAMLVLHSILTLNYGIGGAALTVFTVVLLQSMWLYILVVRRVGINPMVFSFGRR